MKFILGIQGARLLMRRVPAQRGHVVFLTGNLLSPDTREILRRIGAADLTKPLNIGQLKQAIARVLQAEPGFGATGGGASPAPL